MATNKKMILGVSFSGTILFIICLVLFPLCKAEVSKSTTEYLKEEMNRQRQQEGKVSEIGNPEGEDYSYHYPSDEYMKEKLKETLEHVKEAKREIQNILDQGVEIKEYWKAGNYGTNIEKDNASFIMRFWSSNGGIRTVQKKDNEKGHSISFYGKGSIKSYQRRDNSEGVDFYPSGKLERYFAYFKELPEQLTITNVILHELKTYTIYLEPLEKGYVWEYGLHLTEGGTIERETIKKYSKIEETESKKKFLEEQKEHYVKQLQNFDGKEIDEYLKQGGYNEETRTKMIEDSRKFLKEEIQKLEKQIENMEVNK
jgi:hypothetical protein